MAVYGQGQMLGEGFDPRLLIQDYSGITEAARMQAQALSGLGATIGGAIKSFGEAKKENQEMEGKVKAAIQSIDSLSKLVPGFDAEAAKSSLLDPDTPLRVRSTLGEEAVNNITNMVNFGVQNRQMALREREIQRLERQPIEIPVEGGTMMMQYTPEGQFAPIQTTSTSLDASLLSEGLRPYAGDFVSAGQKYNVDPKVLAAIAEHETAGGTSSAFRNKKNAMGISNTKGPIEMPSVASSIDRMASLFARGGQGRGPYAGADQISEIANIYAPKGAGNDPRDLNQFWTSGVSRNLQKLGGDPQQSIFAGRPGFTPSEIKEAPRQVFVPQDQVSAILQQGGTIKGTPYSDATAGISGMLVDPGGVTIGGQKTSNVPKFRPASPQEAAQYGETAGQIDETTGRFYPPRAKTGEQVSITTDREGKTTVTTTPVAISGDKAAKDAQKEKQMEAAVKASATATTQDLFEIKRKYEAIKPEKGVIPSLSRIVAGEITGTETQALKSLIDRVTSGLTLDKLQSIRQNSPTGGALGNVSNKDTALLQDSVSNLKAAQNPQEFNREWTRLTERYLDIAYGSKEQRDQFIKDGKITAQQNAQIESLYPGETIGAKGELIQRQKPQTKTMLSPEVKAILERELGK